MSDDCAEQQRGEGTSPEAVEHDRGPAREISPPLMVDGPEALRDSHC